MITFGIGSVEEEGWEVVRCLYILSIRLLVVLSGTFVYMTSGMFVNSMSSGLVRRVTLLSPFFLYRYLTLYVSLFISQCLCRCIFYRKP